MVHSRYVVECGTLTNLIANLVVYQKRLFKVRKRFFVITPSKIDFSNIVEYKTFTLQVIQFFSRLKCFLQAFKRFNKIASTRTCLTNFFVGFCLR